MSTLVWRMGLKGPEIAVTISDAKTEDRLDETDRKRKIVSHKLKPEHEGLPLDVLMKLYPPPPSVPLTGHKIVLPGARE